MLRLPATAALVAVFSFPAYANVINHAALPWNCATIRAFANGKTQYELEQFARQYGLTAAQRRAAVACLRKGNWT